MNPGKQILFSAAALVITLLCFELTNTDLWLQQLLYNDQSQHWLLYKPAPVIRFIFYDGIKILLLLTAVAILTSLLLFNKRSLVRRYHRGLRIVLLSLIVVPSVIVGFKATTNVACPGDITEFGGKLPYIRLFESYAESQRPAVKQQCFPAGHASGGFALMALYFLFESKRKRQAGLVFGILTGWFMGSYKMLIGDHFLSHTLVTMISAWLLINIIVIADEFIVSRIKPSAT